MWGSGWSRYESATQDVNSWRELVRSVAEVSVFKSSHFSIYWGNWVRTEVITVLVNQNNIWLVRWGSCQSWGRPRTTGDPDQQMFGVFSCSPQDWWRTCQGNKNSKFQIFKFIVIKMKAIDNIYFNLVRLSAQVQTTFEFFTPIWGRRKIQEDGRWRRRGSHAILHILFNHCHLA